MGEQAAGCRCRSPQLIATRCARLLCCCVCMCTSASTLQPSLLSSLLVVCSHSDDARDGRRTGPRRRDPRREGHIRRHQSAGKQVLGGADAAVRNIATARERQRQRARWCSMVRDQSAHSPLDRLPRSPLPLCFSSLQNFKINTENDRMPLEVIHALALVKKAAATVNVRYGLDAKVAKAIADAADEVTAHCTPQSGAIHTALRSALRSTLCSREPPSSLTSASPCLMSALRFRLASWTTTSLW